MAILLELFTYPFPILIKKISKAIRNRISPPNAEEFREHRFDSTPLITEKFLTTTSLDLSKIDKQIAKILLENFKAHRFDLLGSGPVSVNYGSYVLGVEGVFYLLNEREEEIIKAGHIENLLPLAFRETSKRLFSILSPSFKKIDWHRDYKSGYRFDSSETFNQSFSNLPLGVDLKCPWELTRLQHLPTLAILASVFPDEKKDLVLEFKNQVIDHIAMNPMGIGVNWACAMDVGIRISNILLAYDLIKDLDKEKILDESFHQLISNYAYYHGVFLFHHLEYGEGITSNHYLSNIAGLIFISCYLDATPEVMDWLYFGIQELEVETKKQFFKEGSNFEGSTCYHRLSTEIILNCASIIEGMSKERKSKLHSHKPKSRKEDPTFISEYFKNESHNILKDEFYEILFKANTFLAEMAKPDGEIPQYGDNDSGRFFKLFPQGVVMSTKEAIGKYKHLSGLQDMYDATDYFDESILNSYSTISAAYGLFEHPLFSHGKQVTPLEYSLIKQFNHSRSMKDRQLAMPSSITCTTPPKLPFHLKRVFSSSNKKPLLKNINYVNYSEFGLAVFKSDEIYLSIGYGANRASHRSWGHQHNDKLSVELMMHGESLIVNNGTYLYTSLPHKRNEFRTTFRKNVAYVEGEEQNWWKDGKPGLFNLIKQCKSELLVINQQEIMIQLTYREIIQVRHILFKEFEIEIHDHCNFPIKQHWNQTHLTSNGYGKLLN